ncbi:MAG TPA: type VI secretion system accessory protein TagJ [Rhodocyclaceae bacterium]|nr:tetratricopeptide repeat protein [Rhodocyclaceae bacterium]HMV54157.1 type VI secretion system accessory protein TagJ [Rhodocyclaceae bacterium]HNA03696.1 type VI secretion system accessory protein TagJ [Rhodocyclaceae bacterium]HNB77505.1 type VI secretion system accessory protein TagJ [Rhodocyclaceae bacterium]HNC60000.1 type VI secretion system accessory protein TagJ [Rhodocyclaceae bacterium]
MSALALAESSVRDGDPAGALKQLTEAVKAHPADAKLRVFLFQLLCVLGKWDRALTQLELCAEMDASALAMREMYREAIRCERLREEVFAGRKSPMLFGEPEGWIALLIESLIRNGRGESAEAARLREQAFADAPATSGKADDHAFEWIADADMRLGPVLEAIINGRYYWVPFNRLLQVSIEAPTDLRDYVWAPAQLQFANGGETIALIPSRYPGSAASEDGLVALGRKTMWDEPQSGLYIGQGQRVLATDSADLAMLEIRTISLDTTQPAAG